MCSEDFRKVEIGLLRVWSSVVLGQASSIGARGQRQRVQKVLVQRRSHLQTLAEQMNSGVRLHGEQVVCRDRAAPLDFDEYMNLVLDDAEEIHSKTKSKKTTGPDHAKKENITLLKGPPTK